MISIQEQVIKACVRHKLYYPNHHLPRKVGNYFSVSKRGAKADVLGLGENTADKDSSLFKAEPVYEGRLKVILLVQVSSHEFEPTFIIFCLN